MRGQGGLTKGFARNRSLVKTVTTNASFDFMRKPKAGRDMIANATLLKLGKTLSVTDILLYSEGEDAPVARSTMTYSIPPKR